MDSYLSAFDFFHWFLSPLRNTSNYFQPDSIWCFFPSLCELRDVYSRRSIFLPTWSVCACHLASCQSHHPASLQSRGHTENCIPFSFPVQVSTLIPCLTYFSTPSQRPIKAFFFFLSKAHLNLLKAPFCLSQTYSLFAAEIL